MEFLWNVADLVTCYLLEWWMDESWQGRGMKCNGDSLSYLCHPSCAYRCTVLDSKLTDSQTDPLTVKSASENCRRMMCNSSQLFFELFSLLSYVLLLPSLYLLSTPLYSTLFFQLWHLRFFMFYIQCCCLECSRSVSISVQSHTQWETDELTKYSVLTYLIAKHTHIIHVFLVVL